MMHLLTEDRYPLAAPLFEGVPFNAWMARAVVDRRVRGSVWTDHPDRPSAAYIRHQYGMAFLLGDSPSPEFIRSVVARAQNPGEQDYLQVWPEVWNGRLRALGPAGPEEWERFNFRFDPRLFLESGAASADPAVVPTPADRAWSLPGTVVPRMFWNSPEDFQAAGGGFSALAGTTWASTAFASYRDSACLEIGIETLPAYRGQGWARRACAGLIRYCLDRGLEPVWSCRGSNLGSARLAESLGFRRTLVLPYWNLDPGRVKNS